MRAVYEYYRLSTLEYNYMQPCFNPLLHIGHYSVRMVKIRRDNQKNFIWELRLWVSRR